MYTDIKVSRYVNSQFYEPFVIYKGVGQGCTASLLVFSLYMDRLEAFLESNLLGHLTALEKPALRVAGILLSSLFFANNFVFLATQQYIVARILDMLS